MSGRVALVVAVAALGLACGDAPSPKPSGASRQKAAAPAATSPGPADAVQPASLAVAEPDPDWSYSSVGKRDPFRSFLAEVDRGGGALATRCATPLGRFELDQLRLVAVVTGLEDPVAMVEAPTGVGYSVRRGSCVGKNGGVVTAVRSGELVVSEWVIRADGTRDRTQTVLRLPREAALKIEE